MISHRFRDGLGSLDLKSTEVMRIFSIFSLKDKASTYLMDLVEGRTRAISCTLCNWLPTDRESLSFTLLQIEDT